MSIQWKTKSFDALTVYELYEILQLRSQIFVVEQNCVYQDLDGMDSQALYLWGEFEGKIVAHARLFKPGITFETASIGRVVVDSKHRNKKWGHELMQEAIKNVENIFGEYQITIGAQLYLKNFYETHGFIPISEMYLEDGIPHIKMKKE
ncbi:GNAT family N-acetyltransferase [Flavobacterium faecale]|uniref:GNAT family N-acetyltransferase n=1 Tax=Flavobacterium faecale TaxID=1355330 RepID=UPI003AAF65F9